MTPPPNRLIAALEGRYTIERELGQGGMATVYLATDLKHERRVALKVLKPDLAAVVGAERFLAEIKTTANLQHPHILPLYDSGSSEGLVWYVMPYLQGESLRDLLDRQQQLGVKQAVDIAVKVADALDHAHEQGVVHRDVKPGNILLSDRGEPLVADFGIALAVTTAGEGRVTETGLSMGTPHYMSPEQATGDRDVDPRSDIWALGCVLYEMLAGSPPFAAQSAQAVLAKILTEGAPDVTSTRPTVPPNVAASIDVALQRLPADRFDSAGDFSRALSDPGFVGHGSRVRGAGGSGPGPYRLPFFAAVAVALLATLTAVWTSTRSAGDGSDAPVTHFTLDFEFEAGVSTLVNLTPDGRRFAVRTPGVLRILDFGTGLESEVPVPGSGFFDFEPGGESILYLEGNEVVRHSLVTGARTTVADSAWGVTWVGASGTFWSNTPDGRGILQFTPDGDRTEVYRLPEGENGFVSPSGSMPDEDVLLLRRTTGSPTDPQTLLLLRVSTGAVLEASSNLAGQAAALDSETIVYSGPRALIAQRVDLDRLELVGPPTPVLATSGELSGFIYRSGTAIVLGVEGVGLSDYGLAVLELDGSLRRLPNLPGADPFGAPDVSPDGSRVAVETYPRDRGPIVWVYDLPAGPLSPLSAGDSARAPRFSADGEFVYYLEGANLWRRRTDGALAPELVLDLDVDITRVAPHPDGRRFYLQQGTPEGPDTADQWDITMFTPSTGSEPEPLFASPDYSEGHPDVSPDGRWIAYYSAEADTPQLFVSSIEGPAVRQQISVGDGRYPRWGADGSELFFAALFPDAPDLVYRASLDFSAGRPRVTALDTVTALTRATVAVVPGTSRLVVPAFLGEGGEIEGGRGQVVLNFDRLVRETFAGDQR